MSISKLLKATLLATILLLPLTAEEIEGDVNKCNTVYDKCVDKCADSDKCIDKCDEKYDECIDSSENSEKESK